MSYAYIVRSKFSETDADLSESIAAHLRLHGFQAKSELNSVFLYYENEKTNIYLFKLYVSKHDEQFTYFPSNLDSIIQLFVNKEIFIDIQGCDNEDKEQYAWDAFVRITKFLFSVNENDLLMTSGDRAVMYRLNGDVTISEGLWSDEDLASFYL